VLGPSIATWNGWNSIEEGAEPLPETSSHRCIGAMAIRIDLYRSSSASIRGRVEGYHRSPYWLFSPFWLTLSLRFQRQIYSVSVSYLLWGSLLSFVKVCWHTSVMEQLFRDLSVLLVVSPLYIVMERRRQNQSYLLQYHSSL
jgi:hypothetical protein